MCVFSQRVEHVGGTQIFARGDGARQWLAYRMSFAAAADLAMILPLPVPPGSGEDAVRFVDLSEYPELFTDLERGFPAPAAPEGLGRGLLAAGPIPRAKLVVHDVGDFEASFVPSRADFDRLDPRFRLDPAVWDRLPQYADYGFAVFKLRATQRKRWWRRTPDVATKSVHPMVLSFPRRDPASLFFPTVHVHDGEVHAEAEFDHTLYAQLDPLVAATAAWRTSDGPASGFVDAARAVGLVDPDAWCHRREVRFTQPNVDIVLTPPKCRGVSTLEGVGDGWAFRLSATANYYTNATAAESVARQATAREHLDLVHDHLVDRLTRLVTEHRGAWSLGDPGSDAQTWWLSSDRLWPSSGPVVFGPDGPEAPDAEGPGRVQFSVDTPRIEPCRITLDFAELPPFDVAQRIRDALRECLLATPLP